MKLNPRRRGFILMLVLLTLAIAAIAIGVSVQRTSMQHGIVQRQLSQYTRHHELMGIRDLVQFWATREENRQKLPMFAKELTPAYRTQLPSGTLILLKVRDGQGTALARLDKNLSDAITDRVIDMLRRVPSDKPQLLRRFGPTAISFLSAPDDVVHAVAGDDPALYASLTRLRSEPDIDLAKLSQGLTDDGIDYQLVQEMTEIFTFDPTLWRFDIEVFSETDSSRYTVLAEVVRNVVKLREWKPVAEKGDDSERLRELEEAATESSTPRQPARSKGADRRGRDRGTERPLP